MYVEALLGVVLDVDDDELSELLLELDEVLLEDDELVHEELELGVQLEPPPLSARAVPPITTTATRRPAMTFCWLEKRARRPAF